MPKEERYYSTCPVLHKRNHKGIVFLTNSNGETIIRAYHPPQHIYIVEAKMMKIKLRPADGYLLALYVG